MENSRYIARLYGLDPDYVEAFCRWLCGLGEYFDQAARHLFIRYARAVHFALMLALDFDITSSTRACPTHGAEFNRKAGEILRERLRTTTIIIVSHQAADA